MPLARKAHWGSHLVTVKKAMDLLNHGVQNRFRCCVCTRKVMVKHGPKRSYFAHERRNADCPRSVAWRESGKTNADLVKLVAKPTKPTLHESK